VTRRCINTGRGTERAVPGLRTVDTWSQTVTNRARRRLTDQE
jgi:hypothetical protein